MGVVAVEGDEGVSWDKCVNREWGQQMKGDWWGWVDLWGDCTRNHTTPPSNGRSKQLSVCQRGPGSLLLTDPSGPVRVIMEHTWTCRFFLSSVRSCIHSGASLTPTSKRKRGGGKESGWVGNNVVHMEFSFNHENYCRKSLTGLSQLLLWDVTYKRTGYKFCSLSWLYYIQSVMAKTKQETTSLLFCLFLGVFYLLLVENVYRKK